MSTATDQRDYAMRETAKHIRRVQELIERVTGALTRRGIRHDESKWGEEEWPYFAESTSKLRDTTYGTPEYRALLDQIRPAVDHHQQHNSHHPEFFAEGVADMSLLDLMEMLADWKAATERHADGDLMRSIEVNRERFDMPDFLVRCLRNTVEEMGWDQRGDQ